MTTEKPTSASPSSTAMPMYKYLYKPGEMARVSDGKSVYQVPLDTEVDIGGGQKDTLENIMNFIEQKEAKKKPFGQRLSSDPAPR